MRRERIIMLLLCVLLMPIFGFASISDTSNNKIDANGRKVGYWVIDGNIKPTQGYTSDQIIEEGTYVSNKKNGLWKRYFPNGNTMSEIHFENNMPNGHYTTFYKNGSIQEKSEWVNSRNVGEYVRYHSNGSIAQEFHFNENGLRDGIQKYYYENGQLELLVNIKEGKEDGELKRYYSNGDIKEMKLFTGGSVVSGSTRNYEPIKKEVPIEEASESVKKSTAPVNEKTNIELFKSTGHNTLYYKNRLISQTGYFKKGRLWNGKKYNYDSHGILESIDVYKRGRYKGKAVLSE